MKKAFYRIMGVVVCITMLCTSIFTPICFAASDIYELTFENLFVFEQWANNANSGIAAPGTPGTLTKDISAGSFTLTHTGTEGTETYTAHSMGTLTGYYFMDIEPNTSYTLSYDVIGSVTNFESFMFFFNGTGNYTSHINRFAINYNLNEWTFTTPEDAEFAQLRFDNNSAGSYATVSKIRLCKTETYEYTKDLDFRKIFTYSQGETYGELPELSREGIVFAGWYTGPDGTGEKITADTVMSATSYSLYSKWDPIIVGDLRLVSAPVKTEYCLGEKLNTAGLVVSVAYPDGRVENIDEGLTCSPEVLNETGRQTVTVTYGSGSTTFEVNVKRFADESIVVNSSTVAVEHANDTYTFKNTSFSEFNKYELTYSSDAYVKGLMTFSNATVEEFFLEPATNGTFSGYIDGFLAGTTQSSISHIQFLPLNKKHMDFTFFNLNLSNNTIPDNMVYLSSDDYKIGINLAWGGALTYLEDLKNDVVEAQKQKTFGGTSTELVQVGLSSDFKSSSSFLGTKYTTQGNVNLINCHDTGRLVQQSYYGTGDSSYVPGNYQTVSWPYNPVQGGNLFNEASKIVDLKVSENEIYIKCRPLDWAKEAEYITPSYMEAWYTLESGVMRATCRFVDFSGYPSITTTQEFPAFYCVEPLKNFVYYSGGEAWSDSNTATSVTDLQFWGDAEYAAKQQYTCNENWGAFVGDTTSGYGIGIYAPGQTHMNSGVFNRDTITSLTTPTALCDATSYIGVFDSFYFQSYNPISYCYYITTGNTETIRNTFKAIAQSDEDMCNGTYTNGFCDMCGRYQKATLTTNKYDIDLNGSMDSVYEIGNAGQLLSFRDYVNNGNAGANAVLTDDIVFNENLLHESGTPISENIVNTWYPIGTQLMPYSGIFDGRGHTISGLYYNDSSASCAGLFGYTSSSAMVGLFGITDSYFTANAYAGSVVGNNAGLILNAYCTRTIVNANTYAGGIAGLNKGTVQTNYSTASVSANTSVGAMCGGNTGTINNSYYLAKSAINTSGTIQNGVGTTSDSAVTDDPLQTEAKSLEEFYSGEVAYLLQKYNSNQVWGQASNSENSSPVHDYTGEFKVNMIDNADSYSIVYVGDAQDDGDVDVFDYQEMVNISLSQNQQYDGFRELMRIDLNGDGHVDALDCYEMALLSNGLHDGIYVYKTGDFDFDGREFTEIDVTEIKRGLINQNTLSTWQKYACDVNRDGTLDVKDKQALEENTQTSFKTIYIDMTEKVINRTRTANVIIISGQSNAYGASPFTDQVKATVSDVDFSNVKIKYNNINSDDGTNNWKTRFSNNSFETFRPGIGGQAELWFGPELGLSYYLATNEQTKDELWYIIKYTAAGTYLGGNWIYDAGYQNAVTSENIYKDLGTYLADGMVSYVNTALDEISYIHSADKINIRAFMWHQGESDACVEQWANQYGALQKILVNKVRAAFQGRDADANIGFVDGGIAAYNSNMFYNPNADAMQTYNSWVYSDTVNTQKTQLADMWYVPVNTNKNIINKTTAGLYTNSASTKINNSIWVDTSTLRSKYEANNENDEYDGAHYCGDSMLKLGQWYGYAMTQVAN